ncbi:hypothetical protein CLOSTASPAR_01247 [[Clostridium] asparagiforme DSM 15981]|uniref:Uncharacterized protein n=1 Tax=[Clostridium] asparagiforme DSM 15981 TaxID=518636 RepID=C0CW93_9FIRM|nr:hypothetical protein CLOSTASPAR_01247 [[Clostridium] asparagiforme DSM 15981]
MAILDVLELLRIYFLYTLTKAMVSQRAKNRKYLYIIGGITKTYHFYKTAGPDSS